VINADGTHEHAVTKEHAVRGRYAAGDEQPSWSPDGRSIAFLREGQIWIVRADGTHARALTKGGSAIATEPVTWSPHGRWIGFINGSSILRIVRPDGTGRRMIATESMFAWSPDGKRIAVTDCLRFGVPESCRIALIPVAPGRKLALTKGGPDWVQAWSPDGKAIAYVRPSDPGDTLHIVAVGDGTEAQIAKANRQGATVGRVDWRPNAH